MANSQEGCLANALGLIGLIPGVILAVILPESLQFVGLIIGVIAVVYCSIMAMVYKKPKFQDETLGHACKRTMWGALACLAAGFVFALAFSLLGVFDDKKNSSNNGGEQPKVEQRQTTR